LREEEKNPQANTITSCERNQGLRYGDSVRSFSTVGKMPFF
jgi:hypothetical protein